MTWGKGWRSGEAANWGGGRVGGVWKWESLGSWEVGKCGSLGSWEVWKCWELWKSGCGWGGNVGTWEGGEVEEVGGRLGEWWEVRKWAIEDVGKWEKFGGRLGEWTGKWDRGEGRKWAREEVGK